MKKKILLVFLLMLIFFTSCRKVRNIPPENFSSGAGTSSQASSTSSMAGSSGSDTASGTNSVDETGTGSEGAAGEAPDGDAADPDEASGTEEDDGDASQPAVSEEPAPIADPNQTYSLNETAQLATLHITPTKVNWSSGTRTYAPKSGNIFVSVYFVIKNIYHTERTINSMFFFSATADDTKVSQSQSGVQVFSDPSLLGSHTLAPGETIEGIYCTELPAAANTLSVVIKPAQLSEERATFVLDLASIK